MVDEKIKIRPSCGHIDYPMLCSTLLDDTQHQIMEWADEVGKSNLRYLIRREYPPSHHLE